MKNACRKEILISCFDAKLKDLKMEFQYSEHNEKIIEEIKVINALLNLVKSDIIDLV